MKINRYFMFPMMVTLVLALIHLSLYIFTGQVYEDQFGISRIWDIPFALVCSIFLSVYKYKGNKNSDVFSVDRIASASEKELIALTFKMGSFIGAINALIYGSIAGAIFGAIAFFIMLSLYIPGLLLLIYLMKAVQKKIRQLKIKQSTV